MGMNQLTHATKLLSHLKEAARLYQASHYADYDLSFESMPYAPDGTQVMVTDGLGQKFILKMSPVEQIPRTFGGDKVPQKFDDASEL